MTMRPRVDPAPYLRARAQGLGVAAAARKASISPSTADYWRRDPDFRRHDDKLHKAGPVEAADTVPVGIEAFVSSPRYLNKAATVRPAVLDALRAIYEKDHHTVLAGGAIGVGKTFLLQIVFCYELYLLSCRDDPHADFGLDPDTPLILVVQNRTEALSRENNFATIKSMLSGSEYFRKCYPFGKQRTVDRLIFANRIEVWSVSGDYRSILGTNPFVSFIGEVNFMDVTQKSVRSLDGEDFDQAREMFNTAKSRQMSRFYHGGRLHSKMLIASSARHIGAFTDSIEREAATDSGIYVWKLPIWRAKPEHYSFETFGVFVGDRARNPRILKDGEAVDVKDRELVLRVPVDLRRNFARDIYRALQDDAGIATQSSAVFFPDRELLEAAFCRGSVFAAESIVSGERVQFQYDDVPNPGLPRFVHLDLSKTKDSTGVAVGHVSHYVRIARSGVSEIAPHIVIDGVLQIRPPQYSEINFGLIRAMLYSMRGMGFNIAAATADTFQSVDMLQELGRNGFRVFALSVDRTLDPYSVFKDAVLDGRIELPRHGVLHREALGVEIDYERGKVDHPPRGSKDCLDAVVGVTFALTRDKVTQSAHGVLRSMTPPLGGTVTVVSSSDGDPLEGWSSRSRFEGNLEDWLSSDSL
jgi:hypothetical protein